MGARQQSHVYSAVRRLFKSTVSVTAESIRSTACRPLIGRRVLSAWPTGRITDFDVSAEDLGQPSTITCDGYVERQVGLVLPNYPLTGQERRAGAPLPLGRSACRSAPAGGPGKHVASCTCP